jgi:hypothetical protein
LVQSIQLVRRNGWMDASVAPPPRALSVSVCVCILPTH